jgi:DNA-binding CsgD family transcriptional regulator
MPTQAEWSKLNQIVLACGVVHDPQGFCFAVLRNIGKVIHFDQARCYLIDERGDIYDMRLFGIDKRKVDLYLDYYSLADNERYSVLRRSREELKREREVYHPDDGKAEWVPQFHLRVMDWSKEPHDTTFYRDYVAPLCLTYSTGFPFYDMNGRIRVLYCLDLTTDIPFSSSELRLAELAAMHLGNLYVNFFVDEPVAHNSIVQPAIARLLGLTPREREIASCLMRGRTPKMIAEQLGISRETVYKHISNIHEKLGVSNQVELISYLRKSMGETEPDEPAEAEAE